MEYWGGAVSGVSAGAPLGGAAVPAAAAPARGPAGTVRAAAGPLSAGLGAAAGRANFIVVGRPGGSTGGSF